MVVDGMVDRHPRWLPEMDQAGGLGGGPEVVVDATVDNPQERLNKEIRRRTDVVGRRR